MRPPAIQNHGLRVEAAMMTSPDRTVRAPVMRLLADAAASFDASPPSLAGEIGGVMLEAESPVATPSGALAQVMGKIDALQAAQASATDEWTREMMRLPPAVRDAALEAISRGARWKRPVRGIGTLALSRQGGAEAQLIRAEPGFGPPCHDHAGEEYALILTGAYHDGHERYRAGELQISQPGDKHRPVADAGEVCFVLGVNYGPLRFTGLLGLAQKLLRF